MEPHPRVFGSYKALIRYILKASHTREVGGDYIYCTPTFGDIKASVEQVQGLKEFVLTVYPVSVEVTNYLPTFELDYLNDYCSFYMFYDSVDCVEYSGQILYNGYACLILH